MWIYRNTNISLIAQLLECLVAFYCAIIVNAADKESIGRALGSSELKITPGYENVNMCLSSLNRYHPYLKKSKSLSDKESHIVHDEFFIDEDRNEETQEEHFDFMKKDGRETHSNEQDPSWYLSFLNHSNNCAEDISYDDLWNDTTKEAYNNMAELTNNVSSKHQVENLFDRESLSITYNMESDNDLWKQLEKDLSSYNEVPDIDSTKRTEINTDYAENELSSQIISNVVSSDNEINVVNPNILTNHMPIQNQNNPTLILINQNVPLSTNNTITTKIPILPLKRKNDKKSNKISNRSNQKKKQMMYPELLNNDYTESNTSNNNNINLEILKNNKGTIDTRLWTPAASEEETHILMTDRIFVWLFQHIVKIIELIENTNVHSDNSIKTTIQSLTTLLSSIDFSRFYANRQIHEGVNCVLRKVHDNFSKMNSMIFTYDSSGDIFDVLDSSLVSELYVLLFTLYSYRSLRGHLKMFNSVVKNKKEIVESIISNKDTMPFYLWIYVHAISKKLLLHGQYDRQFYRMMCYLKIIFCIYDGTNSILKNLFQNSINDLISDTSKALLALRTNYCVLKSLNRVSIDKLMEKIKETEEKGGINILRDMKNSIEIKKNELKNHMKSILPNSEEMACFVIYHFSALLTQRLFSSLKKIKEIQEIFKIFSKFTKMCKCKFPSLFDSKFSNYLSDNQKSELCCNDDLTISISLYIIFSLTHIYLSSIEDTYTKGLQLLLQNKNRENKIMIKTGIKNMHKAFHTMLEKLEDLFYMLNIISSQRKIVNKYRSTRSVMDQIRIQTREFNIFMLNLRYKIISAELQITLKEKLNEIISLYENFFGHVEQLQFPSS